MSRVFYIVLIVVAACSKSPLGPEISDRPDPVTTVTGVTSGGQTDADDTTGNTAGGDDTETTTDKVGDTAPVCSETTTQNFFYPGATVSHSFTCDLAIATALNQTGNRPSYLAASGIGTTTLSFTGTQTGATGATSWTTRFNGWDTADLVANTTILATTPTSVATPSATLVDDTVASFDFDTTLDASYDGAGGELKVLMSDAVSPASTSNGAVAYAAADIPLLAYTDATCATATAPYICPTSGTNTAQTASAGFDLRWNYDIFDQGTYDVVTKGYQSLEGATVYSATDRTTLTVADQGGEQFAMTNDSDIGKAAFKGPSDWEQFSPAIALNDTLSTSSKQVFGVAFAARPFNTSHFAGVATIDRSVDANSLSTTWFNSGTAASRLSLAAADTASIAIAGTSTNDWIYFGGSDGGGGSRNLVLSYVNDGGASVSQVALSSYNAGEKLFQTAITPAFDDGGTQRHGIAWFGFVGGAYRVWVSKIDSSPADPTVEANYFAAGAGGSGGYYDTAVTNQLNGVVSSVPIVADQGGNLSLVKITNATVSGANYFYVGWRVDATGTVYFARVDAGQGAVPTVRLTKGGDQLTGFDSSMASTLGRPAYAIAGGNDSAGNPILGVFYTQEDGFAETCNFQAYRLVGTTLEKWGTAHVFGAGTTDCRFPHLYYNASTGKFMAIYVSEDTHDTTYVEFQFDGAGNALVPANPTELTITNRTATPCQFAASYSATWQRIGLVSLESTNCTADTADDDLLFDIYKTAR